MQARRGMTALVALGVAGCPFGIHDEFVDGFGGFDTAFDRDDEPGEDCSLLELSVGPDDVALRPHGQAWVRHTVVPGAGTPSFRLSTADAGAGVTVSTRTLGEEQLHLVGPSRPADGPWTVGASLSADVANFNCLTDDEVTVAIEAADAPATLPDEGTWTFVTAGLHPDADALVRLVDDLGRPSGVALAVTARGGALALDLGQRTPGLPPLACAEEASLSRTDDLADGGDGWPVTRAQADSLVLEGPDGVLLLRDVTLEAHVDGDDLVIQRLRATADLTDHPTACDAAGARILRACAPCSEEDEAAHCLPLDLRGVTLATPDPWHEGEPTACE